MKDEWRTLRLGDICDFKYGKMPSKSDLSVDGAYEVFSGYRIVGRAVSCHYADPQIVVVARGVGGTGDVKLSPPNCFLTNLSIAILPTTGDVDKDYLFYELSTRGLWHLRTGSAQAQITIERLRDEPVRVPGARTQRRIVGIAKSYDDLIENCERRIRVLDEMSRSLYREWFVHFRYPGHENTPLVDSALGRIPKGWEVKPIADLIETHIGGGWGSEAMDEKHTSPGWVIRGTDIADARGGRTSSIPHRFHGSSNIRTRTLAPSDIVFETSGGSKGQPVGRSLLVTSELLSSLGGAVICASFCKKVRVAPSFDPHLLYLSFVEGYSSGEIETYQVQSTGISNFKWSEYIAGVARVIPPRALQQRFGECVGSWFASQATLGQQSENLRKTRDLLLPRLLSGQLSVDDASAPPILAHE